MLGCHYWSPATVKPQPLPLYLVTLTSRRNATEVIGFIISRLRGTMLDFRPGESVVVKLSGTIPIPQYPALAIVAGDKITIEL